MCSDPEAALPTYENLDYSHCSHVACTGIICVVECQRRHTLCLFFAALAEKSIRHRPSSPFAGIRVGEASHPGPPGDSPFGDDFFKKLLQELIAAMLPELKSELSKLVKDEFKAQSGLRLGAAPPEKGAPKKHAEGKQGGKGKAEDPRKVTVAGQRDLRKDSAAGRSASPRRTAEEDKGKGRPPPSAKSVGRANAGATGWPKLDADGFEGVQSRKKKCNGS